jgi:beta-phosphoglucomutase-like phosphatase (HAD superfamily)
MISFEVKGAIFDVDDTLLDNFPGEPGQGLHERSRLAAVQEVGKEMGIPELVNLSPLDNKNAFLDAPVHTTEAAVWNILMMTGLADTEVMNPENEIFKKIVTLKDKNHLSILRQFGKEVPGATAFVRALCENGLKGKLAVASSAARQDVDIFFGMTGLGAYFPAERVFTKESITHPKPHPQAFNLAFDSLDIAEADRAQVCAFEDDPRGIMAAKAAGLYTCAITTRFDRDKLGGLEVPPDLIADSYQEFAGHFGLSLDSSSKKAKNS